MGRPSLAIVLGAGASYDCWNGACPKNDTFRPPLAKDLFANLENQNSLAWRIAAKLPGVRNLATRLVARAKSGVLDLEVELNALAQHSSYEVRRDFVDIPLYIREYLYEASTRYLQGQGNYQLLLQTVLADTPHNVTVITLNYDTLLEQALAAFQPEFAITEMSDYVAEARPVILKAHGSIDWFRSLGVAEGTPNDRHWRRFLAEASTWHGKPVELRRASRALSTADCACLHYWIDRDNVVHYYYPALTVPLADKGATPFVCPPEHLNRAAEALASCDKLLVIGTSGLDRHVLDFMATCMRRIRCVHYVTGNNGDVGDVARRFETTVAQIQPETGNHARALTNQGFSDYMRSDLFSDLLRA